MSDPVIIRNLIEWSKKRKDDINNNKSNDYFIYGIIGTILLLTYVTAGGIYYISGTSVIKPHVINLIKDNKLKSTLKIPNPEDIQKDTKNKPTYKYTKSKKNKYYGKGKTKQTQSNPTTDRYRGSYSSYSDYSE
uniref:Transmembrane protein n=1 Tax=Pithovirus LCPAC102 TaxID=2506587 RepID=A0A4D5XFJ6_9VIRU|nr:MAG: hypothetical protein LCPAC102_02040 [Pithovirus LCPAC102]